MLLTNLYKKLRNLLGRELTEKEMIEIRQAVEKDLNPSSLDDQLKSKEEYFKKINKYKMSRIKDKTKSHE